MLKLLRSLSLSAAVVAAISGCADGTGVGGPHNVALNFQITGSAPAASVGGPSAVGGPALVVGPPLVLVGTNGTLTLEEVRLVVAEVEIEKDDDSCSGDDHGNDDIGDSCEEFNVGPQFVDLLLDGQPIQVVTDMLPAGIYEELEFEIEDLEDDEDNAVEAALIAAVRSEILAVVPDWPEDASALVVGSFTPTGGSPVDFRVFLKAEIEVEMDLIPNLVIEGGVASRALTVNIQPEIWFAQPGGAILDLSQFDYDATGQLLEFEVEFEDGFTEIEIDD
jgi:hypothetical protein